MSTATHQDLLIELGTEELPPKSLQALSEAFAGEVLRQIDDAGLAHGPMTVFASPRRLAVLLLALGELVPRVLGIERRVLRVGECYRSFPATKDLALEKVASWAY